MPIVAAACNELRKRGVVDTQRPVRLTAAGRAEVEHATGAVALAVTCPGCGGRGIVIPPELAALEASLQAAADGAPGAKAELDQTHCTVATKVARVLRLHEANALAGQRIMLLGDDDLISVAIAELAAWMGSPGMIRRLAVVDADPDVLAWIRDRAAGTGVAVELIEHDLRQPLPPALRAHLTSC